MNFSYSLRTWADVTEGTLLGQEDERVDEILTDSRDVIFHPESVLFAALKTRHNDGNRYIPELMERGVKMFLTDCDSMAQTLKEKAHFIVVSDTLQALQKMAAYHRSRLSACRVGITGSNGKTIVKEWLYYFLHSCLSVYRSPGSFNSQLGLPLSILKIKKNYDLCLLEAGISRNGEMSNLEKILQPEIGILTWFGNAHAEGFSCEEEKWKEKNLLFRRCKKILLHIPTEKWHLLNTLTFDKSSCITLSESPEADYFYSVSEAQKSGKLTLRKKDGKLPDAVLPFSDEAAVRNLACCLAFMDMFYPQFLENCLKTLNGLPSLQTRLDISRGLLNSILIHDYYSSDPDSLKIALNALHKQAGSNSKKIAILAEFGESGMDATEMSDFILHQVFPRHADRLFLIGEAFLQPEIIQHPNIHAYRNVQEFLLQKSRWIQEIAHSVVLIKGARKFALEQIAKELRLKSHQTILEIYPERIRHNLKYFHSLLQPEVKIMAMVKAMGYGTGSIELSLFLQQCGIDYLAVAFPDEGAELRKAGIHLPIMVMNPEEDGWEMCLQYGLEPVVYSFGGLNKLKSFAYLFSEENPLRIHIEFDTGMKRLGFRPADAEILAFEVKKLSGIHVQSAFSHFASAENPALDDFSKYQWNQFQEACHNLHKILQKNFIQHMCNTAGTVRFPWAQGGMVRLGIGLYGIGSCEKDKDSLQLALRWVSRISQLHSIDKNESVGYGRNYISTQAGRIATLPLGYADGFSRRLGNGKSRVKIRGCYYPTAGNICMDMCMIELPAEGEFYENDEVVIFETPEELINLANRAETIPYEIISTISSRVKRVYIYD